MNNERGFSLLLCLKFEINLFKMAENKKAQKSDDISNLNKCIDFNISFNKHQL